MHWVTGKEKGRIRIAFHSTRGSVKGRSETNTSGWKTQSVLIVRRQGGLGMRPVRPYEARGLVTVVRRERLAAGREVLSAWRGALRARQRGGRGRTATRACARCRARLTQHVARFPHGRSYNTPNTKLFINYIQVANVRLINLETQCTDRLNFAHSKSWMFDECRRRFDALLGHMSTCNRYVLLCDDEPAVFVRFQ